MEVNHIPTPPNSVFTLIKNSYKNISNMFSDNFFTKKFKVESIKNIALKALSTFKSALASCLKVSQSFFTRFTHKVEKNNSIPNTPETSYTINLEQNEIDIHSVQFQDNEQTSAQMINLMQEILLDARTKVEPNVDVFAIEYFGMGKLDYYFLDKNSKCYIMDCDTINYADSMAIANNQNLDSATQLLLKAKNNNSVRAFTIFRPGRREALGHMLSPAH